ncbi:3-deoxy-D-manno-octulosonate 8-phosphate phosphatase (KDO 8-P phosphatase) [Solimonas aquatica]|uniref:3-deoxy-D-manno-octulosonate 8-phosphate phosphatase KdsC n=1 Tax=Solimonas aquatica TaxID=489703 RepID=A0A1H9K0P1_9GAMM|nr:HAD hydrolase family protein [Solimonas aquatica]SEQ92568.1 3-deoxy-D-manno-octulosonate 8-phosphate phosphatase (KDO 8-P phosphatase) [Solimonas aquatica]
MNRADATQLQERAAQIRCLFLDIDGVLTDGKLYIGPNGEEIKTNYVRDGLGIKMMLKAGLQVAVISGRPSEAMRQRLSWLGVQHIALDTEDKEPAYLRIRDALGLTDAQCAHMGDDVPDLPLMRRCGLALSVADAHLKALRAAHWVSQYEGGRGAVREAVDLILEAQGLA